MMAPLTREQQLLVAHNSEQVVKKLQLIKADRTRAAAILTTANKLLNTLTVTANPPPSNIRTSTAVRKSNE